MKALACDFDGTFVEGDLLFEFVKEKIRLHGLSREIIDEFNFLIDMDEEKGMAKAVEKWVEHFLDDDLPLPKMKRNEKLFSVLKKEKGRGTKIFLISLDPEYLLKDYLKKWDNEGFLLFDDIIGTKIRKDRVLVCDKVMELKRLKERYGDITYYNDNPLENARLMEEDIKVVEVSI